MKKVLVCALGIMVLSWCGSAMAQGRVWDDLSWWGQSGATPAPVKDERDGYPGYWWWPTQAASNADDAELWGNRGVVYAMYEAPVPPEVKPPQIVTPPPTQGGEIPILNHVLFDFDKAVLKPEGKAECDKVKAFMDKEAKSTASIEGHTCDIGAEDYNMGLGQRRANAVKDYLVGAGVGADRLQAVSLGETKPAVANDSAANRKLNRRCVITIALPQQ